MNQKEVNSTTRSKILTAQKNEITEYHIYNRLTTSIKDEHNQNIIRQIANDELKHYKFWKDYSQKEVRPSRVKIWFYFIISVILGITFGIKLMEKGEEKAQETYADIAETIPEAREILEDEDEHEKELIDLMDIILPYLIFAHYYLCLVLTLLIAVFIIFVFNFYISVAQDVPFGHRFGEMATISLGIAALSFGIGFLIRHFMGIEV